MPFIPSVLWQLDFMCHTCEKMKKMDSHKKLLHGQAGHDVWLLVECVSLMVRSGFVMGWVTTLEKLTNL